jgi:acyl-CoA thioesterase I
VGGSAIWRAEAEAGDGAHPGAGGYELLATLIGEPLLQWLETPLR